MSRGAYPAVMTFTLVFLGALALAVAGLLVVVARRGRTAPGSPAARTAAVEADLHRAVGDTHRREAERQGGL